MSGSEEDTYSMIFASLKHPIRRRILRILSDRPQTFSDLLRGFQIESSHLTYHLEGLGNLLVKTEDGKYALSSLGEAAVSTMKHVEEPPKTTSSPSLPSTRQARLLKPLAIVLICGLAASLIFNAILLFGYTGPESPQKNTIRAPLFWHDVSATSNFGAMYGFGIRQEKLPPSFEMTGTNTLLCHYFGIRMNSSTKVLFQFRATASINFRLTLDTTEVDPKPHLAEADRIGQVIINERQATSLNSEFYVQDAGVYIFVFEPVESNPASTVTFNAQLN